MRNGLKRGLAAALCAVLSLTALAGCSKKEKTLDTAKALLSMKDGGSISAGAADFYLRYQQADFENSLGSFLKTYYGGLWDADLTGSGEAYGNIFKQEVLEELEHMVLANTHAADYSVALSDDENKAIADAVDAFLAANTEETLTKMGATKESVTEFLQAYTVRVKVEEAMAADMDTEVSDEEAAQRTVSYVSFTAVVETEAEAETEELEAATEGEGVAEAATEAALEAESEAKTGAAEDETEDGESVAESVEAETEAAEEVDPAMAAARMVAQLKAELFLADAKEADDFAVLAQNTASADANASYSSYTFGDDDTYPDAAIIEATKGLEDGALVENVIVVGNTFYVLHVDDAFDEAATESKKEQILHEREHELVESIYAGWEGEAEFTLDTDVWTSWIFDCEFISEQETEDLAEEATEGAESVAETVEENTEAATE